MTKPTVAILLAASVLYTTACNLVDDDQPKPDPGEGDTDGFSDNEVCVQALDTVAELECPAGFAPQVHFDGGTSNVILIDDPTAQVGLNLGLFVDFGAGAGADWVATQVTQNSVCTYGCFSSCPAGESGCFMNPASGGSCTMCGPDIDEQYCVDFVLACQGIDPGGTGGSDDGGLDESGGADETGGADTTGGVMAGYDCSTWDPSIVYQLEPAGAYHLPQALVDQLVIGTADALAECDGVRFRETSTGHWAISAMGQSGLLGALGLQIGDELQAFDGVALTSLDAIAGILVTNFLTENGTPRQFTAAHPGFSLRVRRDERRFVLGLRVDPASSGGDDGGDETGATDTTGG